MYQYNGKELVEDNGLGWHSYGKRYYDAAICRFPNVDPLIDTFHFVTGYNYAENEPVAHIDLWGLQKVNASEARQKMIDGTRFDKPAAIPPTNKDGSYDWMVVGAQSAHEAKREFASGGTMMFGGFGKASTSAVAAVQRADDLLSAGLESAEKFGPRVLEQGAANGRVFWSGGDAAMNAANKFATTNGLTTLEMTRAGQNLNNLTQGIPPAQAGQMWQRLSATFANGATGPVHVFQNASTGVRLNSVWRTIEYPRLNGKNNIIYHNVFKR